MNSQKLFELNLEEIRLIKQRNSINKQLNVIRKEKGELLIQYTLNLENLENLDKNGGTDE